MTPVRSLLLLATVAGFAVAPTLAQGPMPAGAPLTSTFQEAREAGEPGSSSVESGIRDWQGGRYEQAVRTWRPLADRGDVDAQFNLGHAYRLGRGVPQNVTLAEQWYERAARSGHTEAQAMYGLLLFQNGRRRDAMPFVRQAAERGDARAQYVYGTALFNGDVVARDWPRAYAFMIRASSQGLPFAQSQLREMDQHIPEADRARGSRLADAIPRATAPVALAASDPPPGAPAATPGPGRPRVVSTDIPASSPPAPRTPTRPAASAAPAPRPATPASGGRWRIQLGAFSTEANARRAWDGLRARLPGLQPSFVRAGAVFRLQAGPLASRAAAEQSCAAARQACFPVAP